MLLNKSFPFNISSRIHVLIGLFISSFVLFILFFLQPFNSGNINFPYRKAYFIVYGIITFVTYIIMYLFSILYYKKVKAWNVFEEIVFCFLFIITSIIIAFFYTEIIINKNPTRLNLTHFLGWFENIFLGFGILLFIVTILMRKRYTTTSFKNKPKDLDKESVINTKNITISGSLKKESFQVNETNLVYIKSENNYVCIFYFQENLLKEKLIRSSLTNIQKQLPSFIKIHRSYIVNPNFIISLKGNKQNAKLYLNNVKSPVPISQSFFETVNGLLNNTKKL